MSLWLYSSGDGESNGEMDAELMATIENSRPRFSFIPAFDDVEDYYDEFIDRFSEYAYINFQMFNLERGITKKQRRQLLDSDLIYLSGGNTFHLLHQLQATSLLEDLKDYARSGMPLAGHSAGAITMTPNIRMASVPSFDCDENEVNLSDWRSLRSFPLSAFPITLIVETIHKC